MPSRLTGQTSSATRSSLLRLALIMLRELPLQDTGLGLQSHMGAARGSRLLEDQASVMKVNDGPKGPNPPTPWHRDARRQQPCTQALLISAQASAQAFLTTQGCSGWQATSWHSQASRCQPPAWTPSPHPGRPSPCCPRHLPHRRLGLLLPTLCISAQGPGDAYTASEHL